MLDLIRTVMSFSKFQVLRYQNSVLIFWAQSLFLDSFFPSSDLIFGAAGHAVT